MGWSLSNFASNPAGAGFVKNPLLGDNDITDMIPGIGDANAQDKANAQNIKLDRMNRDWQERMSNSAYQRAMIDMRKAGLNPILAYQQGGASVPSTSAPTVGAASKTRLADSALQAYTGISAAHSQQQQANTAQAQAQSSIALQATQAAQTVAQTAKAEAETEKVKETIKSERVRRRLDEGSLRIQGVKTSAADLATGGIDAAKSLGDAYMVNSAKDNKKMRDAFNDAGSKWKETHSQPSKSIFQNFKDSFIKNKGN